jgi:hypothetical protein
MASPDFRKYPAVWFGLGVILLMIGGLVGSYYLSRSADSSDDWPGQSDGDNECVPKEGIEAPGEMITVSGLPAKIELAFGYGRGTRVQDTIIFAVTAERADSMPDELELEFLPLASTTGREVRSVAAYATRITGTPQYRLFICINADSIRAGSYDGPLIFASPLVTSDISPLVTVTLQNQLVPYILLVFGPLLILAGIVYVSAIVIRRGDPAVTIRETIKLIGNAFKSLNGLIAIVAGTAAVYTLWRTTVNGDATWGQDWPLIPIAMVSLAGAAAAAATIPLGLSTKSVREALNELTPRSTTPVKDAQQPPVVQQGDKQSPADDESK